MSRQRGRRTCLGVLEGLVAALDVGCEGVFEGDDEGGHGGCGGTLDAVRGERGRALTVRVEAEVGRLVVLALGCRTVARMSVAGAGERDGAQRSTVLRSISSAP